MKLDFVKKYAPQTIHDIVYNSPTPQQAIADIVSGAVNFPSIKKGILLYGVYGTGKTELAKLLPDAIEGK